MNATGGVAPQTALQADILLAASARGDSSVAAWRDAIDWDAQLD
jgi:hypothetical protein